MMKKARFLIISSILALGLLSPEASFGNDATRADGRAVNVGGYIFPPFVEKYDNGEYGGLALEMIALMNRSQEHYEFRFVPTSPKRRYKDFEEDRYDMILFESIRWGWEGRNVASSRVYLDGGEVYIARTEGGRDQRFFDDLEDKSLAVFLGYHYGFADFNADTDFLKRRFNATATLSHDDNIRLVLSGRVDIAVITQSFLKRYLKRHPDAAARLLISEKLDQPYRHTVLVRKGVRPDVTEINRLLTAMEESGELSALWRKHGIVE